MSEYGEGLYARRRQAEKVAAEERGGGKAPFSDQDLDPGRFPRDPTALPASFSRATLTHLMLPSDCFKNGIGQGGVVMKLMDNAAAIVAIRHCQSSVSTVSIEAMDFNNPVHNRSFLHIHANLDFASQK